MDFKLAKYKFISITTKRGILWLIAIAVFYLFSSLVDPFNLHMEGYKYESVLDYVLDISTSILICILIAEISLLIDNRLDKWLPWRGNPRKRIVLQTLFQILASVVLVVLISLVFDQSFIDTSSIKEITSFGQWLAINIAVSLTISAFNTGHYFLQNWTQMAMEATEHKLKATELKQAAMAAELQALKLQIDPHFIFNNLSVLSELILENQQLGYEYSENFAKVYRYLLVNSQKDIIALEDELKFLDAYIFLTQKRIGAGVVFNISIAQEDLQRNIPPITLQFLVENALKHNQTTKTNPLIIDITSTGNGSLLVRNSCIPLLNEISSSGIGLDNIVSRYAILSERKPEISRTTDSFIVKLPLL